MNIKNHEIIHEISRGAITTVYKAKHLNLDRIVLLKVLNQQWLKEEDLLKRFKQEAQISAHLQHPNIVNVYDFEISPELVFISLEFIDGQTLSDLIKDANTLPIDKITFILHDALKALQYAHKKGVIHRDLKPDNILIDQNLKASITDFGLASFNDIPAITEQGQSMGTPAYMAPEQIQGKPGNAQSDLYSLGITLYEMLSNTSPFLKENTAATLQSILSDDLKDICSFRNDIPDWLIALTKELTNKKVESRSQNATTILEKYFNEKNDVQLATNGLKNKKAFTYFVAALIITFFVVIFFNTDSEENNPYTTSPQLEVLTDSVSESKAEITNNNPEKNDNEISKVETIDNPEKENVSDLTRTKREVKRDTFGGFYVICTPWATVFLNGDSIDTTPMKEPIQVKTGKYLIELVNQNYKTQLHEVEIKMNIVDSLNIRLEPNFGYLMVKASPWAKLFINGSYKEDTPLQKAIIIPAGKNIIKLQNPTFKTITDTIFVEAGKSIEKYYSFIN
ncbi:MAG: serine/threonine protein kinase [Calditrichaeota bacterium]|nr:MAG: serine/threonine protein kinase [Calditrichota bacterium]MBL1206258.1 serine/threonine protein kinase [Calditrichota bacterium]NOG46084.1 serine/threonine protein kinase [Calditrichota bacterium]